MYITKEKEIEFISKNGCNIEFIENPCYDLQLAAIQQNHNYTKQELRFIKRSITYQDLIELLELKILDCEW